MALVVENPPANVGDVRIVGSVPGLGRSPGGGPDNPLQYSCLENPTDRGAWGATVHGVAKKCLVGYSPWSHKESDTACRGEECFNQFSVPAPLSLGPSLISAPFLSHLCFKMASSLVYLYRPGRGQEEGSAQSLQHLARGPKLWPASPPARALHLLTWAQAHPSSAPAVDAHGSAQQQQPQHDAPAGNDLWPLQGCPQLLQGPWAMRTGLLGSSLHGLLCKGIRAQDEAMKVGRQGGRSWQHEQGEGMVERGPGWVWVGPEGTVLT